MRQVGPLEPGAWRWVDPPIVDSRGGRPWRPPRWLAAIVVAVALLGAGFVVRLAYRFVSTPWDGERISISNQCGYDVYADDGYDGLLLAAGETIEWGGASPSLEKSLRLWRGYPSAGSDSEGLSVIVRGDSILSGSSCPAGP